LKKEYKNRIAELDSVRKREGAAVWQIDWMDAALHFGKNSYTNRSELPDPGAINQTVGFMLDDSGDFFRVAAEFGEFGARDVTDIPKAWILRKRKLG